MEPSFTIKHSLWFLVVLVLLQAYPSTCYLEKEREGLLLLKSYFMSLPMSTASEQYLAEELSSWEDGGNYCLWNRVTCSGEWSFIQHVTKLSLGSLLNYYGGAYGLILLDLSLFQPFEELISLDLAWNGFQGIVQIQELAHLKNLQVLNLSRNYNLSGSLLGEQGFCELRNLQELKLHLNAFSGGIPKCLWSLSSLRILDLSHNNFTGNFPSLINLPSLEFLSIHDNNLRGRFSLGSLLNHSKLEWLFLSNNTLQVEIEERPYASAFKLKGLGLGDCNVNVQYQAFSKFLYYLSNLEYVDLSNNGLVGSFPVWLLQNNTNLTYLNLRNNSLAGSLMLPKHINISLSFLDVSSNNFKGKLPNDIGMVLSSLTVLKMSKNSFDGHIPSSFGSMKLLYFLDLSRNSFIGEVPRELFSNCTNLQALLLSRNKLKGDIIPSYMNLSFLYVLHLDHNNLGGTIKSSLNISTHLWDLDISNNNARGKLPSWIGDLQALMWMSLAGNQFQGDIPVQLCKLKSLISLDLSKNRFSGEIPSCDKLSNLGYFHMQGNHLSGAIPKGLASLSKLVALDLRNNHLSGGIPQWIDKLSNLVVLQLGNNQLEGNLPVQLCHLQYLNILDLSRNRIFGAIPSCLGNLPFGAKDLNVSQLTRDWIVESMYWRGDAAHVYWEDESKILEMTRQEEVQLIVKGRYISYMGSILSHVSTLDLSHNKLTGGIPLELGELTLLYALNLSHNRLFDSIPKSFSKLKSIESLDLSSNNFSGTIPLELVDLTFLANFNVSYNNLSGQIPKTGQFGTFDNISYIGNPLLCGSILPGSCGIDDKVPTMPSSTYEGDEAFDMEVFLWSFGMCYVTVLLTFVVVLAINPYWRRTWFAFIDAKFLWWFNS